MAEKLWTIASLLRWTTRYLEEKIKGASRLEAELLLSHALGMSRLQLYLHYHQPLTKTELAHFKSLLKRRTLGEPLQYITGYQAFWTMKLAVGPQCLIPRPDTECVVEQALKLQPLQRRGKSIKIADIGTGSGAIALALAKEIPQAMVLATDISLPALLMAKKNAKQQDLSHRICFMAGDLFEPISHANHFDLIISNPPYVTSHEYEKLDVQIRAFEPRKALEAGPDGMDIYKRLIPQAFSFLVQGGYLIVEIGFNQAEPVQKLFNSAGFTAINSGKDYGNQPRWVSGQRPITDPVKRNKEVYEWIK